MNLWNSCHGHGFFQGCEWPTHTHTLTNPYLWPAWVCKPVTIPTTKALCNASYQFLDPCFNPYNNFNSLYTHCSLSLSHTLVAVWDISLCLPPTHYSRMLGRNQNYWVSIHYGQQLPLRCQSCNWWVCFVIVHPINLSKPSSNWSCLVFVDFASHILF